MANFESKFKELINLVNNNQFDQKPSESTIEVKAEEVN